MFVWMNLGVKSARSVVLLALLWKKEWWGSLLGLWRLHKALFPPAQQAQVWSVTGFFMAPQAAVRGSLLWESPAVSLGLCSWLHSCCSFAAQRATKTWHVSLSQESAPRSVLSFFCPSSWSRQTCLPLWEQEEPSTMSAWMLQQKPWNLTFISRCWERASCAACCDV